MKIFLPILVFFFLIFSIAKAEEFFAVKFEMQVSDLAVTVGKESQLSITVRNLGLLTDNYIVEVKALGTNPQLVEIKNGLVVLEDVKTNEAKIVNSRVTIKSLTSPITLRVNVTSGEFPSISQSKTITIKTGFLSFSEFDFYGVVQIISISVFILALYLFKKF